MKKSIAAALFLALPGIATAKPVDCPLRDQPLSVDAPVMDIMLSEAAKAAFERAIPGTLAKLPPMMSSTKAPAFSAIMSIRSLAGMVGKKDVDFTTLNKELLAIKPTAAEKEARCARYDTEVPKFTMPKGKLRVLLFEKMTGFRDGPSVEAAHAAVEAMATRNGWAMVTTDKAGAINPATLKQFDVVVWNNISGDVLTLTQRKVFEKWVSNGGGFAGFHGSAGDPTYFWDWYPDTLIGARFIGHPMQPQFQDAKVGVEVTKSGIIADLPPGWTMKDEWYSFRTSPRATSSVIATLDESTYILKGFGPQDLHMGADHPIAWTRCVGGTGRSFYSAIGHMPQSYSHPNVIKLMEQGIAWAAGTGATKCVGGKEVAASQR